MSTEIEGRLPVDVEAQPAGAGGDGGSGPPALPRLGPRGWLRWGWRQLTSMRSALFLLLLLAIAAIPGSVLPQRPTDPMKVSAWVEEHPRLGPWVQGAGGFDQGVAVHRGHLSPGKRV